MKGLTLSVSWKPKTWKAEKVWSTLQQEATTTSLLLSKTATQKEGQKRRLLLLMIFYLIFFSMLYELYCTCSLNNSSVNVIIIPVFTDCEQDLEEGATNLMAITWARFELHKDWKESNLRMPSPQCSQGHDDRQSPPDQNQPAKPHS